MPVEGRLFVLLGHRLLVLQQLEAILNVALRLLLQDAQARFETRDGERVVMVLMNSYDFGKLQLLLRQVAPFLDIS